MKSVRVRHGRATVIDLRVASQVFGLYRPQLGDATSQEEHHT